jgi:hypothetical protein
MDQQPETAGDGQSDIAAPPRRRRSYTWAELMARVFLFKILECPRCGGRMKIIAAIEERSVIRKILDHLGLSPRVPRAAPSRSPQGEFEEIVYDLDCL